MSSFQLAGCDRLESVRLISLNSFSRSLSLQTVRLESRQVRYPRGWHLRKSTKRKRVSSSLLLYSKLQRIDCICFSSKILTMSYRRCSRSARTLSLVLITDLMYSSRLMYWSKSYCSFSIWKFIMVNSLFFFVTSKCSSSFRVRSQLISLFSSFYRYYSYAVCLTSAACCQLMMVCSQTVEEKVSRRLNLSLSMGAGLLYSALRMYSANLFSSLASFWQNWGIFQAELQALIIQAIILVSLPAQSTQLLKWGCTTPFLCSISIQPFIIYSMLLLFIELLCLKEEEALALRTQRFDAHYAGEESWVRCQRVQLKEIIFYWLWKGDWIYEWMIFGGISLEEFKKPRLGYFSGAFRGSSPLDYLRLFVLTICRGFLLTFDDLNIRLFILYYLRDKRRKY